ncbi:Elongation factor 1-gamma [Trichoplax sp. H2]|uniref:Elongation factor 1-gamma n=1 Tax=Trichoplax adhaerens TaxID=10228 RepID=B3RJK0_TRIAD|nr:expressed hypothetical protein [Trichoplax adhaerens]EDV29830.1 expressed hypothetical protein [Trichoplax adhaerens]RDD40297.1 Elongation factor 1-gamma [Trichoplax sp. H2]|eukprot:XP_002109032.1 expressed hypothetical protein [Trichoplax adhaerens]
MASGVLYTYPDNFRAYKILVAAQYSNTDIKVISEPTEFVLGETNKSAGFLEKFPLGKVPAFEGSDGTCIYETNAIAYYVSNAQLHGKTKTDAAKIMQYISLADNEVLPHACSWVFPTYGIMQYNKQASLSSSLHISNHLTQNTEKAKEVISSILKVLNNDLSTRTFLVGERVTLADISLACNLYHLFKQVLDPAFRAPYPNVNRWFTTLVNQPQFRNVIGEFKFCEKMAQFDAKRFAELQGKDKKDQGKDKKDQKKEKKQKEETKAAKPKPKPQADDDDEKPKESKKPDPFANLAKSAFVLDAFKRVYSNEDTEKVAIPYFWENFDKEGFSIWKGEYKYPEDLKKIFMSCNLVSGMFQRIEKLKKHAFGSVCIFGKDGDSTISGIWIMRGQELIFNLDEDWNIDAPSYEFVKLDVDKSDDKKLINEYLLWEGDFGGRKFNQGKIFK